MRLSPGVETFFDEDCRIGMQAFVEGVSGPPRSATA